MGALLRKGKVKTEGERGKKQTGTDAAFVPIID